MLDLLFWRVQKSCTLYSPISQSIGSVQSLNQFGCQGDMRGDSAEFLFQSFCKRSSWAILARAGMFTLWCCPSSISSANYGIAHPPRYLGEWFQSGCHARIMQVSIPWQLPEETAADPQGSWSWFTPSHWSCAPSRRYWEVFSCTWFWMPGSFFQGQLAGSLFHSRGGGWGWQDTCRAWTCLQTWWCCTTRS